MDREHTKTHPVEENNMPNNRISAVVLMVAVAVAAATASFNSHSILKTSDDFALRHPQGLSGTTANVATTYRSSDYAARHPELGQTADTSDYYLRHAEWMPAAVATDTSDYFLRHSELFAVAVVDTSDYFLRHLEFIGQ
jgi:hypothetical protein